jgi:hypothetical protein
MQHFSITWLFVTINEVDELLLYTKPEPVPPPANPLTSSETTEGETNCAILLTFAPVAPISIAVLPLAQLPFVETNKALVLLSTQAFTTGTDEVFATAKPPTLITPIKKPINNLAAVLFIFLLEFRNCFYMLF